MIKAKLAALLVLAGCATSGDRAALLTTASEPAACALSAGDRAWIDRAVEAWRFASRQITGIGPVRNFQVIFFDASCVLRSSNAFSVHVAAEATWTAEAHSGTVTLPNGAEVPVGVTSFASGENGVNYFVMSTPTVWVAGNVPGGGIPLETMMVAVVLHEASHVAQTGPYGPRLGRLIEANSLPDSFSDDSMQHRFQANAEFAASVQRETELFMQAAAAADDAEGRRLAREARAMMLARADNWFVGADAYWREAEDVWLTFEGAGQWTGYQWLVHPQGGAVDPEAVNTRFVRGRWWSQTEGFAVVSALHRLIGPDWKRHAYGDGAQTVLEMLDTALAER